MQGYKDVSRHPSIPASLDALRQLREHSLIIAEELGGEMRYRMLETLREFGAEQLTPKSPIWDVIS